MGMCVYIRVFTVGNQILPSEYGNDLKQKFSDNMISLVYGNNSNIYMVTVRRCDDVSRRQWRWNITQSQARCNRSGNDGSLAYIYNSSQHFVVVVAEKTPIPQSEKHTLSCVWLMVSASNDVTRLQQSIGRTKQ